MQFEYMVRVKGNKTYSVTGEAEVHLGCDCSDHLHAHVAGIEYDSVQDAESGLEYIVDDDLRAYLDERVEGKLYAEIAQLEAEAT